jgi:hypothetical protein
MWLKHIIAIMSPTHHENINKFHNSEIIASKSNIQVS